MEYFPAALEKLVEQFARLPGIGGKSAQRLAFHVLSLTDAEAQEFADAIVEAKKKVTCCPICRNLTDGGLCPICASPKRDERVICVVADARDVAALERSREYSGRYHVLHGVISPMNHVGPDDLEIKSLVERVAAGGIDEVIMATNPDTEGEATAMYLARLLRPFGVRSPVSPTASPWAGIWNLPTTRRSCARSRDGARSEEDRAMTAKLELYRVFREVAETGNISAAAQNLYISQSAVSQSVKQLEGALQTRLFIRSPRGVTLTDDGQMLFEHVRSAMGLLETGEEKLAQTRALQMGKLVIGASDTVTSQFLLPHLDSFHKKYPNIHIQIISGRSHKVLGLLRSGKVDVAFASSPSEDEGLSCVPCFATHSCFVAAADYPCDFERAYSMQELAALPLILLERKASSRVYLEKYFLAHGVSLSPEIELGARSLLVDLARIGFGVAGVTREFVTAELESGAIRELKTDFEIPPRSVDMCTLRDVPPSAATARFTQEVARRVQAGERG